MATWDLQSGTGQWELQSGLDTAVWDLQSTGGFTWTLVQSKSGSQATGASLALTFDNTPTPGNLIITRYSTNDASYTISGSWGAVTIAQDSPNVGDGDITGIGYRVVQGGDGSTITATPNVGNASEMQIEEWTVNAPGYVISLDKVALSTTTAASTSKDAGTTGSLTNAQELIVSVIAVRASISAESFDAPFKLDRAFELGFSSLLGSTITQENGSETPTGRWTTAGTAWGASATFKVTAPVSSGERFTATIIGI